MMDNLESEMSDIKEEDMEGMNNCEDKGSELEVTKREPQSNRRSKRKARKSCKIHIEENYAQIYIDMNTCGMCNKTFKNKGSLNLHLRTHTGYKPHICHECGRGFTQIVALQQHIRVHTGDRPYKCTECEKTFSQLNGLNQHVRTHSGLQPYECPICFRKFSQNGSLKAHVRIHSGDKPFSCPDCGRKFNQSGSLKAHLRTHEDHKPFSCSKCDKSFTQKIGLKQHMRSHEFPAIKPESEESDDLRVEKAEPVGQPKVDGCSILVKVNTDDETVVLHLSDFTD